MFKYLNKYMNTMMREMVDIKKELKGTSRGENISEMKVLLHGINSRYILKNFLKLVNLKIYQQKLSKLINIALQVTESLFLFCLFSLCFSLDNFTSRISI